jgi:transcriptional regulator with XRE-family HTH domain
MIPRKKMSATIRKLRERQNMTQAELAKKVKVTQGYISQLEAGTKKELGAKVALRLADALGVPVTELLG